MLTLFPYLYCNTWVFDDSRTGLQAEAFVSGMSEMISRVIETKSIANAEQGFALSFSDQPFDGYDVQLTWVRAGLPNFTYGLEGNWYRGTVAGLEMEGWLCPALGLYFVTAPRLLYIRAEPLPAGVNPFWQPSGGDERQRRFVSADPK